MLDHERRARIAAAKAKVRELMKPDRESARIARAKARVKREKALTQAPDQRQPRVQDKAYLAALRRRRCYVGAITGQPCAGRTDPAHIRFTDLKAGRVNPGLQNKSDDRWCLPVCRKHHDEQHAYGNEAKWWAVEVGVDPNDLAREVYADFETGGDGEAVLRRFIPTRAA